jgi:Spy/CpxP family protein refolding chaperone
MKRTLILTLIVMTAATVAFAQLPPREMIDHAAKFVGLTADQKAQWDAWSKDFMTSVQPLIEQRHTAHRTVESLLEATPTDACAIGNAAIAAHNVDGQIKAAHDAFKAKMESILTADQKTKLEAFLAAQHPPEPGHPHPEHY